MAETYSREDLARLERVISDSNALITRQEEIIEKVIKGELEIGKTRIAQLEKFFDTYSSKLDTMARRTSDLSDTFLILERQATENARNLSNFKTASRNNAPKLKTGNSDNEYAATSERTNYTGNNRTRDVGNTIPDEARNNMGEDYATRFEALMELFQKTLEEQMNDLDTDADGQKGLADYKSSKISKLKEATTEAQIELEKTLKALVTERQEQAQAGELSLARLSQIRVTRQQEAAEAELNALKNINMLSTELTSNLQDDGVEAGTALAKQVTAEDTNASAMKQKERMAAYEARRILEEKRKNNGILDKEAAARIKKEAALKFKFDKETLDKITKERQKVEEAAARKKASEERRNELSTLTGKGSSWEDRKAAYDALTKNEAGERDNGMVAAAAVTALDQGIKALSNYAQRLESQIDSIGAYKGDIDTRLQGSSLKTRSGSYWDQITRDMMSVGAVNPFFKQEDFAKNIRSLVDEGIAFDLEQRAFLMTVQDKIANTFDVADGTLLRLVRIQQEDSTAGRLGMEAALNSFLNSMYENTEYLKQVADSVRGSLAEMEALMSGAEAAEVEYQVQKWLGSLYSVGMSNEAVSAISTAFGQIAAGQIDGLQNGAGNLLVMAANDAGLSIADMLTDGINSSDTNKLLQAVVNYLAELAESSKDNKVVQQQLAEVFGVKASDLKAATNLVLPGSTSSIYGNSMSYSNMMRQLFNMAGSMGSRTSMGEMISNILANGEYSMASGMASNPAAYLVYKMASALQETTGGISLPFLNVMGFGVDLETTVADLMRVGAMSAGILSSLGPMISGLGNSFNGQSMLKQLGISSGSGLVITPRGDGSIALGSSGGGSSSTSGSGYIGNASGSDIKDTTLQEADDSKKQQMIEAKEEAEANQVDILNTAVIKIYELLDDVAHGSSSLKVRVEGYGLTKAGGSGASSGAQGGVAALNSTNGGGGYTASGVNSGGVGGSVDIGGWIMT